MTPKAREPRITTATGAILSGAMCGRSIRSAARAWGMAPATLAALLEGLRLPSEVQIRALAYSGVREHALRAAVRADRHRQGGAS
jgi:hypothetical protein